MGCSSGLAWWSHWMIGWGWWTTRRLTPPLPAPPDVLVSTKPLLRFQACLAGLWELVCGLGSCHAAGVLGTKLRGDGVCMLKGRQSVAGKASWERHLTLVFFLNS